MNAGRYQGKIHSCDSGAIGENKTPLVKIFFKIEETNQVLAWSGWFSDKINEKTGKTYTEIVIDKLIELGFTGECVSELSNPKADVKKLFNTEKIWNLDIDYQTDKNNKTTNYLEVKWINDPDKQSNSKLNYEDSVSVFKGMDLKGMIAQKRSQHIPF